MKNEREENGKGSEENGKDVKMRVKCAKCKKVEGLTGEEVRFLAQVAGRYKSKLSPVDYTAILSIIKDNCTKEGDKHLFIFDESFDKDVADTIKEYNDAVNANVVRKEDLEKTMNLIVETNDQIKSLESTLKELEEKKEQFIAEMRSGGILIDDIKSKFESITGTADIEMWS